MELGEKYTSKHTGTNTLTVTKMYGNTLASVQVGSDESKNIIVHMNRDGRPQLSLAHVSNEDCELHKVKEQLTEPEGKEIQW